MGEPNPRPTLVAFYKPNITPTTCRSLINLTRCRTDHFSNISANSKFSAGCHGILRPAQSPVSVKPCSRHVTGTDQNSLREALIGHAR